MNLMNRLRLIKQNKRYVDIHITDHCNLNCRGCAHFSSISDPYYMDIDELESMYKKLQPIYDTFFNSIHLLGGEPMLHPHLDEILVLTRKYFPNTEIQVVSNGLNLTKMPDSFWRICQKENITFSVTKYNVKIDYDRIIQLFHQYHIAFEISEARDVFIHHVLDPKGLQNRRDSYRGCKYGGSCIQLRNNRLYACPQSAYIEIANKRFGTNLKVRPDDFLDLDRLKYKWQMNLFLLMSKSFCRYCNVSKEKYEKWQVSKKEMDEWFEV